MRHPHTTTRTTPLSIAAPTPNRTDDCDDLTTPSRHARHSHAQVERHGPPSSPPPVPHQAAHPGTVRSVRVLRRGRLRSDARALCPDHTPSEAYILDDDDDGLPSLFGRVLFGVRATRHGASSVFVVPPSPTQRVAVKMSHKGAAREERERRGCPEDPVREADVLRFVHAAGHPHHPHVSGLVATLQDETYLYLITPRCERGDLLTYLNTHKDTTIPEPQARFWTRQVLSGLHHLHTECGICVRDLCAENILLGGEDGRTLKMVDFGMSLRIPRNDANGMRRLMVPSPRQRPCQRATWQPPENWDTAAPYDGCAVDVWGVGVLVYVMLTGTKPPYHKAVSTDADFVRFTSDGGLRSATARYGLSETALDLLERMFHSDPRDRPTLAELLEHPWLRHGEVEVPPAIPSKCGDEQRQYVRRYTPVHKLNTATRSLSQCAVPRTLTPSVVAGLPA